MKAFFWGLTLFGTVLGCTDPVEELQSLEAQVRQLETIEEDTALVARAAETFQTFAAENPEDTLAPRYALMAGDL